LRYVVSLLNIQRNKKGAEVMKKTGFLLLLLVIPVILLPKTGIGIIVGEPTGISFKQWTSEQTAFDAALAYSFSDKEHFYFHLNYLHHNEAQFDSFTLPWYWGFGANIRYREDAKDQVKLAGRLPLGIYHMFNNFPGEIFLEVAPGLDVVPDIGFNLGAAIGFRYYFN